MIEALILTVALQHANSIPEFEVPKHYVAYEKCVCERESNCRPNAVNPTGKYRGAYQFDDAIKRGTTYHIIDWLRTWHPKPKKYAARLREIPMNKWPMEVQTAAFIAVLDGHDKKKAWSGMSHFAGGRWHCGR